METIDKTKLQELLGNIQAGLAKSGVLQTVTASSGFDAQVQQLRDNAIAAKIDPAKGQGQKQLGMQRASAKKAATVAMAQRIARDLAANGPITVDTVTAKLRSDGYESNADVDPEKRRYWKGGMFTTGEWVCVGELPSTIAANHARPVKLWALKSWLASHGLNGERMKGSSFDLVGIMNQFIRANPGVQLKDCNWYIGDKRLSENMANSIRVAGNTLYEAPVTFVEGVGAILMPPKNYKQPVEGPATVTTGAKA